VRTGEQKVVCQREFHFLISWSNELDVLSDDFAYFLNAVPSTQSVTSTFANDNRMLTMGSATLCVNVGETLPTQ